MIKKASRARVQQEGPGVSPDASPAHSDADEALEYQIGDLAAELGITTRAIRFYEARGLISPRRKSGSRIYDRRDRARLLLILRGKNLGFTLEDVREYLDLYTVDATHETQVRHLVSKVSEAIKELETKRRDIDRSLDDLKQILDNANSYLKTGHRV